MMYVYTCTFTVAMYHHDILCNDMMYMYVYMLNNINSIIMIFVRSCKMECNYRLN